MRLQKEKWSFRNLEEVHQAANTVLRFAMFNERSKRWPKVTLSTSLLLSRSLSFSAYGFVSMSCRSYVSASLSPSLSLSAGSFAVSLMNDPNESLVLALPALAQSLQGSGLMGFSILN